MLGTVPIDFLFTPIPSVEPPENLCERELELEHLQPVLQFLRDLPIDEQHRLINRFSEPDKAILLRWFDRRNRRKYGNLS